LRQFSAGRTARLAAASILLAVALVQTGAALDSRGRLALLERTVAADPEDLRACADYRQEIISTGEYDRAIRLLKGLATRPGAGPNVHISLALAYVDQVPVVGTFRRVFLGQDAMRALSVAIQREPSLLAYYIRGLIALYYPESIFHRARGGIGDLERARALIPESMPQPHLARVYITLGDGFWKVHDLTQAVAVWTEGARRFPADAALRTRLANRGTDLDRLVDRALDPAIRVDTSLREIFDPAPGF